MSRVPRRNRRGGCCPAWRSRWWPPPSHPEPAAVAVAQTLRAEFQEWVRDAEAAHARAQQLERQGLSVAGAAELDNLIGATLAMLQVTLEDHFRSLDQIAGGQTFSIEDLRRELQLKRGA
jgi:hypothetical protein